LANFFDVAVIGAGPAGAATALCLSKLGWRVVVNDCASLDRARLGETLPPETNPVLQRFGIRDAFLEQSPLPVPGVISRWGSASPAVTDFVGNPYGSGWHIDRRRFDAMLCHAAQASGATVLLGQTLYWSKDQNRWRAGELAARCLVNATGRTGLSLDRELGTEREDTLLAAVFRGICARNDEDARTWIESAPAGWWYSALLPDRKTITMFFTGAEIYRAGGISFAEQLAYAPLTLSRLRNGDARVARVAYAPSGIATSISGPTWLAVGDSASSYDPLSGRGIYKALCHAEVASEAIDAWLRGDCDPSSAAEEAMSGYVARVRRDYNLYTVQRQGFYASELRWPDQPFWRRRRVTVEKDGRR
jgi:flavin-dependent dehydrogenase